MKTKQNNSLINVITMGCSKNLVDSEVMMKQIEANGLSVVHNSDTSKARTVIINTCGFINDAKEESIDTILQYAKAKENGKIDRLYVMGCLAERYKPALQKEIPDVDSYFGVNDLTSIIETLGFNYKDNLLGERVLSTPTHYAYLKISEGCDRTCSFCAIPLIRGKHKSRPIKDITQEASLLAKNGTKELILIAQDLTYYGIDLTKKQEIAGLLEELCAIEGIEWIRLHYAYPANFPKELIRVITEQKKICNYLDIPFQHCSDNVLKKMRRAVTSQQTYNLIEDLRNGIPDLTLRTTIMVGHPGEGEKEYNELLEFVNKAKFDRLGVFKYSEEEDTFGARNFKDEIPDDVKQRRADELMDLQSKISLNNNLKKIGTTQKVIIDNREGDFYIGRSEADSPEVDNEILISSEDCLSTGEFYSVSITDANEFDLYGSVINKK
jgi:ribosomal protein S12 methylthiotransferase